MNLTPANISARINVAINSVRNPNWNRRRFQARHTMNAVAATSASTAILPSKDMPRFYH